MLTVDSVQDNTRTFKGGSNKLDRQLLKESFFCIGDKVKHHPKSQRRYM